LVYTVRYGEHFGTLYCYRFAVKLPIFYVYRDAIPLTTLLPWPRRQLPRRLGLEPWCLVLGD